MAKNKFKGLAVVEALIIMALSGELSWQIRRITIRFRPLYGIF